MCNKYKEIYLNVSFLVYFRKKKEKRNNPNVITFLSYPTASDAKFCCFRWSIECQPLLNFSKNP